MADKFKSGPTYDDLSINDKSLLDQALRKGANRREVMGWLIASGATIASAGSIVTAATEVLAATPKKGGRLIMAGDQHGPNDTLDPALYTSAVDYFRGRMFYGSLTRLTPELSYEPELAEEIIPNKDATEWTFKIRKGVTWHNGKDLTADDVIYTMNRHLGKKSVSKAASLVSMIDRWEKVNKHEVKAVLSSPNADLPIALGTFHFKILQDGVKDFSQSYRYRPLQNERVQAGRGAPLVSAIRTSGAKAVISTRSSTTVSVTPLLV